ncbi:hypothetical protein GCM10009663_20980 [Kitasatospora arboriphila]|uniref:Uncharacterized protein n=1 Tax=Kitasatospora arboriphila TaxID=258052 RepID=A0ABP4DXZ7_9ACTN
MSWVAAMTVRVMPLRWVRPAFGGAGAPTVSEIATDCPLLVLHRGVVPENAPVTCAVVRLRTAGGGARTL